MEINLIPVLGLVPVIIGLVAAIRHGMRVPKRFAPIMSVVLGIAGVLLVSPLSGMAILVGIVTGLISCGLYSGVKTTVGR